VCWIQGINPDPGVIPEYAEVIHVPRPSNKVLFHMFKRRVYQWLKEHVGLRR
jgi:hypothetical protein